MTYQEFHDRIIRKAEFNISDYQNYLYDEYRWGRDLHGIELEIAQTIFLEREAKHLKDMHGIELDELKNFLGLRQLRFGL